MLCFAAYRFLMTFDPSPDVRRAVLTVVQVTPSSLKAILQRTRDVRDTVQKEAYEVLAAKVHMKALTIAQRIQLLTDGLKSRSGLFFIHYVPVTLMLNYCISIFFFKQCQLGCHAQCKS